MRVELCEELPREYLYDVSKCSMWVNGCTTGFVWFVSYSGYNGSGVLREEKEDGLL